MNLDFVYGRRPVWEVLEAGKRSLHKLWVLQGIRGGIVDKIVQVARERKVPIEFTTRTHIEQVLAGRRFSEAADYPEGEGPEPADKGKLPPRGPREEENHQGVVAQVSATEYLELHDYLRDLTQGQRSILILLDEVQDPHNVGAILRNAGFFGADGIIIPKWRSAPIGDTAMRVSAGAMEHLRLMRETNLVQAIDDLKEAGFEVLGADMEGEPIWDHSISRRTALVVGNEETGMRRLVREHCDKIIGIPRPASVGSLNVASATAILLSEIARKRP